VLHQDVRQRGGCVLRPSLEYQHAFDCCAVALQPVSGAIAVLASHPFYGRELVGRLDSARVRLFAAAPWDPSAEDVRDSWRAEGTGAEADLERLPASSLAGVVWAEPERGSGPEVLAYIGRMLTPAGRLYVVTSNALRRCLPEWQGEAWRPAGHPAGCSATLRWLRSSGWQVEQRYGFHGPRSALLGLAARGAAALGRHDWFDRCHAAMCIHYVVCGWQASLAPVALLMACKA
jgi:hypothetical protein